MYFDLEDRVFDTPTVESAMSWRERGLLSLFAHVALVLLYLFGPSLPFVRDAAERRAERLEALAAAEQLAMREPVDDQPQFIFVEPFVDTPAPEPPSQASLSDLDRTAQSPVQAESPLNDLPNADGNTFEFVQAEERSDGLDPETSAGTDPDAVESDTVEPVEGVEDGAVDPPDEETLETSPGDGGAVTNPLLADGSDALSPPKLTPTPGGPATPGRTPSRLCVARSVVPKPRRSDRPVRAGHPVRLERGGLRLLDQALPGADLPKLDIALRGHVHARSCGADLHDRPGGKTLGIDRPPALRR